MDPLFSLARRGWLPDLAAFGLLLPSYYRVAFRGAGLHSGILRLLGRGPATAEEVVAVRSRGLRRLLRPGRDPLAAMYEEMAVLDHRLVVEMPERLRQGRPFTLADTDPEVVARDSRIGEPWLEPAIEAAVPRHGTTRG